MSEEGKLDYIPEDLSDEAKATLRALAVESEPEPAPLEVNEYLIRHWCETLEDGNPLYLDEEYARSRGHRGVLAPPGAFMTAFAMQFRWPWPPGGREPTPHIHYDIKDALNLPVGIIGSIEVEMGVPLLVGPVEEDAPRRRALLDHGPALPQSERRAGGPGAHERLRLRTR
jgi:hypothetical protein